MNPIYPDRPHDPDLEIDPGREMASPITTYAFDQAAENLRAKVQRAVDEFHQATGGLCAPSLDVTNTPITTMGQSVHRYISKVDVELQLRTV